MEGIEIIEKIFMEGIEIIINDLENYEMKEFMDEIFRHVESLYYYKLFAGNKTECDIDKFVYLKEILGENESFLIKFNNLKKLNFKKSENLFVRN